MLRITYILIILWPHFLPAQETVLFEYEMQFNYNNFQSSSRRNHQCQLYTNGYESLYVYRHAISLSDNPNHKKMTTMVYMDVFQGETKLDYLELAEGGFQVYRYGDSLINKEIIDQKEYLIKEKKDSNEWVFLDSTKLFFNKPCYLAKKYHVGRTYYAWYDPDVEKRYHLGPWKLFGLPGLIVEAYSEDQAIKFFLKENVPKLSNKKIQAPSRGQIINKEEYWDKYLAFRKTDFDRAHNGVIKNMIDAGMDPEVYQFPIFHNSMEIYDPDLSKFREWAIIKYD